MREKQPVDLAAIREQEAATACNSTVGGYHMDRYCPIAECRCYRVVLEADDIARLFLLGDFAPYTGGTCRISDVRPATFSPDTQERVKAFGVGPVDLRVTPKLLPVAVTVDADRGPLVLIDGNHRAMWQHMTFGGLDGVPIYVCEHPRMNLWLRSRGHPAS